MSSTKHVTKSGLPYWRGDNAIEFANKLKDSRTAEAWLLYIRKPDVYGGKPKEEASKELKDLLAKIPENLRGEIADISYRP